MSILNTKTGRASVSPIAELITCLKRHGIANDAAIIVPRAGGRLNGKALLTAAKGADLLVMGARRTGGRLRHLFQGKRTCEVLQGAEMPVLVAR